VEVHLGLLSVRLNFEGHEIAEVCPSGFLEARERVLRRSVEAQVHVPRGPGSFEAELEHQASLEHRRFAKHARHARKEAIEHEQLPTAPHLYT
jgi:hypothetical protein